MPLKARRRGDVDAHDIQQGDAQVRPCCRLHIASKTLLMRTISQDVAVRLYHLSDDGIASTLVYGTLTEALAVAANQPEDVLGGLFLQTSNDVVGYLDFIEG
jgi:hypothetical protein